LKQIAASVKCKRRGPEQETLFVSVKSVELEQETLFVSVKSVELEQETLFVSVKSVELEQETLFISAFFQTEEYTQRNDYVVIDLAANNMCRVAK
jgi:hypothetical protein